MSNQRNPKTIRIGIVISLDDAARLRTYLRGRTVPAESIGGRGIRKSERPMTPSDFFTRIGHDVLSRVVPTVEDRRWMEERLCRNLVMRKELDEEVKSGRYRVIPGVRSKPGRKAGVYYPAYEKAAARRSSLKKSDSSNPRQTKHSKPKNRGKPRHEKTPIRGGD